MQADFASLVTRGVVDVALNDEALAGYVVYFQLERGDDDTCYFIENIAVRNALAGRGTGTSMMRHVENIARDQGILTLSLYTNAKMTENLLWYPKLGFYESGRKNEDGFDRVYFSKELK